MARIGLLAPALFLVCESFAQSASEVARYDANNNGRLDPAERRAWEDSQSSTSTQESVVLSPFTVNAERDEGYIASGTLAGSRLNTNLRDTPAAISVFTKDFIKDIGATNVAEAIAYGINTEIDRSDPTGNPSSSSEIVFAIRGFSASPARNYFQWEQDSDSYNIERLDFARGPNSILFGTGSPGGIINTTTKRAAFGKSITDIGLRVGADEQYRGTIDFGRQLTDSLAARVNLVRDTRKHWRDSLGKERHGAALAATWRPLRNTEIRFDGEYGKVHRVNTNPFLPSDFVTKWIDIGRPMSPTFGAETPLLPDGTLSTGRINSNALIHDPFTGTVFNWNGGRQSVGPSFGTPSSNSVAMALQDRSILPLTTTLSGDGNHYEAEFHTAAIFIEQRFGDLWLELAANRQERDALWFQSVGFASETMFIDPNVQLPNGQPNPNAGKYYVQSGANMSPTHDGIYDYRLTAVYQLDLTKYNEWLGSYSFSGLLSRRDLERTGDSLSERNLTPAGTALHPNDISHGNNAILRRVYVDPTGATGRSGFVDARDYPVRQGDVNSGFARVSNSRIKRQEELDSSMVAAQAKLFKDRLILTGGIRRDRQRLTNTVAGTAARDPVTGTWSGQTFDGAVPVLFKGNTKTYGGVLHVNSWLSVFYNHSNNFVPQSTLTILGSELGPKFGVGEDYGLKFKLLDGKVYATVQKYETSEVNRLTFANGALISTINEIYQALDDTTRVAGPTSRDGIDTTGDGYEMEITANITPQWRLSLNASRTRGTQSNNSPRLRQYVEERRAAWAAVGDTLLIAPYGFVNVPPGTTDATIDDAIATLDEHIRIINGQNGVTRRQLREYNVRLFTAYTFKREGWMRDLTVGGGFRYLDKPVIGYSTVNNIDPIFGDDEFYMNLMLRRPFKVFGKRVVVQANVDNVMDVDDPIVADATETQRFRFLYPNPRTWSIEATLQF